MRKRSASTAPGAKPRPSAGVETWPTGRGESSRRASEGSAVGDDGELAGAPHDEQNRAASGTSAAQLGQGDIAADCIPRAVLGSRESNARQVRVLLAHEHARE